MAAALEGGYVDTGITLSLNYSASAQLTNLQAGGPPHIAVFRVLGIGPADEWRLAKINFSASPCLLVPPSTYGETRAWDIQINGTGLTSTIVESHAIGTCDPLSTTYDSGTYAFEYTAGPFRLGMKYELIDEETLDYPSFAQTHYRIVYHWFSDENTTIDVTFGGVAAATRYWLNQSTTPPSPETHDEGATLAAFRFGVSLANGGTGTRVKITGITVNGTLVDTSELNTAYLKGQGGGAVFGEGNAADDAAAALPWTGALDLDVTKFGSSSLECVLDVPEFFNEGTLTVPYSGNYSFPQVSWEENWNGVFAATINSTWAQDPYPIFPTDDRAISLWMPPPAASPASTGRYYPIGVTMPKQVQVNRPNNNIPSDWVSSDTGKLTVTEALAYTRLNVTASGALVRREMNGRETWRHKVGIYGTSDPAFGITEYERSVHANGEDVWWWGTHRMLFFNIQAPRAGLLFLTVEGVHLNVYDPHTTGSDRITNYTASLDSYEKTYAFMVQKGHNKIPVDLCLPIEGGPYYLSRVDALELSGFVPGQYQIDGLYFGSTLAGQRMKHAWGKPVQRYDYSALNGSVDGSFIFNAWGDRMLKPGEAGRQPGYGGGVRYINILTGVETGTIMDTQLQLEEFWGQLNLIEGYTANYSSTVSDAAIKDAYGTELGPELAQWMLPLVPYQTLTPDSEFRPPCAVVAREIHTASGQPFLLYTRHPAWGAIETIAVKDGLPAVGVHVTATGGSETASALTDGSGYAVVTPLPMEEEYTLVVGA